MNKRVNNEEMNVVLGSLCVHTCILFTVTTVAILLSVALHASSVAVPEGSQGEVLETGGGGSNPHPFYQTKFTEHRSKLPRYQISI